MKFQVFILIKLIYIFLYEYNYIIYYSVPRTKYLNARVPSEIFVSLRYLTLRNLKYTNNYNKQIKFRPIFG